MSDLIALDFAMLRQHAARVEQVAADVDQAVAAARSLNLSGGAFGLMCSFLVPPAMVVTGAATGMIQQAESLLQRAGSELRGAAGDAETMEQAHVSTIRSLTPGSGS